MDDDVKQQVTVLKRQALVLKKEGKIEEAKDVLAQARLLEANAVSIDSVDDPDALKKMAIAFKKAGDLEKAKAALMRSKQLACAVLKSDTENVESASRREPVQNITSSSLREEAVSKPKPTAKPTGSPPPPPVQVMEHTSHQHLAPQFQINSPKAQPVVAEEQQVDEVDEDDPDLMAAYEAMQNDDDGEDAEDMMMEEGGGDDEEVGGMDEEGIDLDMMDEQEDEDIMNDYVEFSNEELLDVETLLELHSIGSPLPSDELYQERILEFKKKALAHKKEGNLDKAKLALKNYKALEDAMNRLKLKANDTDIEDGEDDDDAPLDFGDGDSVVDFSTEELMDPELMKEMVAVGMAPSADSLRDKAKNLKSQALQFKKQGDLEKAKDKLREAKKLEGQADLIEQYKSTEGVDDDDDDDGDDFEKLVRMEEAGEELGDVKEKKPAAKPQPKPKTSEELKLEAFELKKENKLAEAAQKFREYKALLEQEQQAKEKELDMEVVKMLDEEVTKAKAQQRLFTYYAVLGADKLIGKNQIDLWEKYAKDCTRLSEIVKKKGRKVITITRAPASKDGLHILSSNADADELGFVGSDAPVSLDDLEILVFHVDCAGNSKFTVADDSKLAKKIQVRVRIGLPPNEDAKDENIEFVLGPMESPSSNALFPLGVRRAVSIPRGDSRHAKSVLRRMQRKKITFVVEEPPSVDPSAVAASGGGGFSSFFTRSKPKENAAPPAEPNVMGYCEVELKTLLDENYVAGEFPLMDKFHRKQMGGQVRLAIRTGSPYVAERRVASVPDIVPYSEKVTFSVNK